MARLDAKGGGTEELVIRWITADQTWKQAKVKDLVGAIKQLSGKDGPAKQARDTVVRDCVAETYSLATPLQWVDRMGEKLGQEDLGQRFARSWAERHDTWRTWALEPCNSFRLTFIAQHAIPVVLRSSATEVSTDDG